MASVSSSHVPRDERTSCIITHSKTGTKFSVFLTSYEIERYQQDAQFALELQEKYYSMYKSGYVTAQAVQDEPNAVVSDNEVNAESQEQRNSFTSDVEEQLIALVAQRPPLYDFRLPLQQRSRAAVKALWEEVIAELEVDITVEEISKKWKNMRDSYIRARGNINKKLRSGSSADEKRTAERLRSKHRHYEAMAFVDETLTRRRTSSNLDVGEDDDETSASMQTTANTRSRCSSNTSNESVVTTNGNATEQALLDAIGQIAKTSTPTTTASAETYHFCMRLACGLERLPRAVKNKLELEFLEKLVAAETMYCAEEN